MFVTKPPVAERREKIYLPQAPDDQEKYKYFGGPRRWVFAWLLIASAGSSTGTSMWRSAPGFSPRSCGYCSW